MPSLRVGATGNSPPIRASCVRAIIENDCIILDCCDSLEIVKHLTAIKNILRYFRYCHTPDHIGQYAEM